MGHKFPALLFMTSTIRLSRRNPKNYNQEPHISETSFFQAFMSSHNIDQHSSFVSVMALFLSLGGFATVRFFFFILAEGVFY